MDGILVQVSDSFMVLVKGTEDEQYARLIAYKVVFGVSGESPTVDIVNQYTRVYNQHLLVVQASLT